MMPGYQASDSENAYDFFFRFFSIRPTDPISGNAFDGKQKKKGDGLRVLAVMKLTQLTFLQSSTLAFCAGYNGILTGAWALSTRNYFC